MSAPDGRYSDLDFTDTAPLADAADSTACTARCTSATATAAGHNEPCPMTPLASPSPAVTIVGPDCPPIAIAVPDIPARGPVSLADGYRRTAARLRSGFPLGGGTATASVAILLDRVAYAIDPDSGPGGRSEDASLTVRTRRWADLCDEIADQGGELSGVPAANNPAWLALLDDGLVALRENVHHGGHRDIVVYMAAVAAAWATALDEAAS